MLGEIDAGLTRPAVKRALAQGTHGAGAEAQIATLAESAIKVVAMVSCNPVTFARDAVTLQKAGFTLTWVQVVDQFRWSAHVEVVGSFTRK